MAIIRKVKITVTISVMLTYFCYTYFIETAVYEISYPRENSWNVDFIYQFHNHCAKKFIMTNPPKKKLDYWDVILEELPSLLKNHYDSSVCSFEIYEEKWYLNRFFTLFYLDDQTIFNAIKNKYGKDELKNFMYQGVSIRNISPYYDNPRLYYSGEDVYPLLVYFPFGYPKGSNRHWFLNFWHRKSDGTGSEDILLPASYELADSLKTKENEERYHELVIPRELRDPKNQDKWKNIFRE